MDAILENLTFMRFIGAIMCSVRGYISVLENDLGELGGTVEDYNRNWEFQSILMKLCEREFSGTLQMYKNGFFGCPTHMKNRFTILQSQSQTIWPGLFYPKILFQSMEPSFPVWEMICCSSFTIQQG